MALSALLGTVATVIQGHDPGNLLGAFVAVGTVFACLAVRARSVRLMIPAPTLSYVPAAVIAGAIHDRATDNSHAMDLLNAGSWIANGFLMMILATAAAIVFTGLRLFFDWRYHPQPRSELHQQPRPLADEKSYPRPRPVGDDWDAARRMGPDPQRPQGSGPYQATDTGPYPPTGTGPYPPTGTGPYPPSATSPYRPAISGRPDGTSPRRVQRGDRPADSGTYPAQGSGPAQAAGRRRAIGPARTADSGPYRPQASGPYQSQEPYGSGPYPEPADLLLVARAFPAGRRTAAGA